MNTRFRNLGTTAGLSAAALFLAAGAAFGADVPLSTLNAGPSSANVPTAGGTEAAITLRFPREIVDPTVPYGLDASAAENTDIIQVDGDMTTGVRWRSRGLIAVSNLDDDANTFFQIFGDTDFDGEAAESYILFLNTSDATTITTLAELDTFQGMMGAEFLRFNLDTLGLIDADLTEANLNNPAAAPIIDIDTLKNAVADDGVLTVFDYELAIIVINDVAVAGPGGDSIPTEYICVRNDPTQVVPTEAAFGVTNDIIRIVASEQLVDDTGAAVLNPQDTNAAGLDGDDFRTRFQSTGPVETLTTFLNTRLANTGMVAVAGVAVAGDFNNILEITLDMVIADTDDQNDILASNIGFAPAPGGDVFTIAGETANGNSATFQSMDRAADLGFDSAQLLQGTGQAGFGSGTRQVWVAIDLDEEIAAVGDNNQFQLLDTEGNVIATSITVQDTLPTNVQVVGIDDEDLDGTADDNVIETANNRLFARFVLGDPNDAINSDATWSDNGQTDIDNRDEREAVSVRLNPGGGITSASTALGGGIDPDATETLTDLARPIAIGFLTRAGDTGEFCEFVDTLDFIFDETIATDANTSTNVFLGYNSGATISDLTTGLGAGLTIPTIDIVTTATVNDRRLTATSLALITNFTSNDTAQLGAPVVPVDGTANDGSDEILTGTGDLGYIIAHLDGAVTDTGGLGATVLGTFNMDDELTGDFEIVEDGAAPALMGANVDDNLDEVLAGFSENVVNVLNENDEAESLFVIMENDSVGRRFNLEGGETNFNGDNTVDIFIDGVLDEDVSLDPGYNLSVFNPGFPIADGAGNESDPNITKTKMVLITPPAAAFKEDGVAIIDDDTEKVIEIRLKVTGPVELSEDGVISELADRFFLRGDNDNGQGGNTGQTMQLGGLIEDIEIGEEADADGCYTVTLILMEGMPFPQEDFYVEYLDGNDLESPVDSFLVTPVETGDVALASADIYVSVLRPPSLENGAEGNPLTMTIVGQVDLGEFNSLGTQVTAYVWKADEGVGSFSFVYKGVVHTGTIDEVSDGEVRYFHPQLLGDGQGAVEPMGIINRKPELDITATVTLTREGEENGEDTDIEQEVFVYQNLNELNSASVIKPLRITFRDDTTCPGRFTFNGSGITNGIVTYPGEFVEIGSTLVNGPVIGGDEDDEIGPRAYTLHTRGEKSFAGCPVVLVVEPEDFFASDASAFLANNFLFPVASAPAMRALTFSSDIDRTGANALPIVFNIDSEMVTPFALGNYEQDDWAILPIPTNQGDRGTTGNLPNRVSASNTPVTMQANIPSSISARGAFVVLNGANPELLDIDLALALDSRGVFCGDVCNLNRVATGYAYALEADNLNGRTWFTYGPRFSSGATLSVVSNNSNGGWNLLANLRSDPVAAGSFGGQVNITMSDEAGVRVWASGFGDTNDLEEIGVNEGVLVNTTAPFNSTP